METIALRLFDVDLLLTCNDATLLALLNQLYSQMRIDPANARSTTRHSRFMRGESGATLQVGDQVIWHLPEAYPKFAHNLIWYDAIQHIQSHLLLHGAGIALDGQGTLLIGHSMSGKTTQSLALMQLGAQLLTDDAVGINYATGALEALARQVQIRPKTRHLLHLTTTPRIKPTKPYPLKNLFIFDNHDPQPAHQLILDIQAAPSEWQQQLNTLPSVVSHTISPIGKGWLRCELDLSEPAASCYPAIEQLCAAHNVLIFDVQSAEERTPNFAEQAEIRPIPASEAAFGLLPHLQNRTLAIQFGGELSLYLAILNQLQHVNCYRLQVGTPEQTSQELFTYL